MRHPHGFGQIIGDPAHAHGIAEHDTITCIHCGQVGMVKSSTTGKLEVMVFRADGTHYLKEAGFCRSCMEPVCPKCDGRPCNNRHRRMELLESASALILGR